MTRFTHSLASLACLALFGGFGCGKVPLDLGGNGAGTDPPGGTSPGGSAPGTSSSTPKCTAASATPTSLVEVSGLTPEQGLVVDGDTLWFGASVDDSTPMGKTAIYSVPLAGGTPQAIVTDGWAGGPIGVRGGSLVYQEGIVESTGPGSFGISYDAVLLRDKASGAITRLTNPAGATDVHELVVHPSGIYWETASSAVDSLAISRHDTSDAELVSALPNHSAIALDGKEMFYVEWVGSERHFKAVPIAGGATRTVKVATDGDTRFYQLLEASDALYFASSALDSGGTIGDGEVHVIAKDGSSEHTLATDFRSSWGATSDATSIYWVDGTDQTSVHRMNKADGTVTSLAGVGTSRFVQNIAVDDCNVYTAIVNPPAIYVRAK